MLSASDGSAFAGAVTVYVTIDAGAQAVGSVGSGACTNEGNSYYTYAPAQAETNGALLAFTFSGSGAIPSTVQVFTTGWDKTAAQVPANVTQYGGSNGTFASGRPEVNTSHIAGSAVSTSSAQIGVNVVNAGGTAWATVLTNLVTAIWTAVTDSSGVTTLLSRLSATRAGYLDNLSAGAVALEASLQALITTIGASAAGVATAVWGAVTRTLTAGTNIVLAKGTGVTGFTDLSAAAVNAEVDTAISDAALATAADLATVDTVVDGIAAKTINLPSDPADESLIIAATDAIMSRLGSPAGASVSADIATADGKIDTLTTRLGAPADFGGGQSLAANLQDMVGSPTFDASTDSLEAIRNRGDSAWATADVSGLATASALATVDGVVDAIKVVTDKLDDTLEDNAGTYRFTEPALAEAPSGGGSAPTAGEIADAVWDEDLTDHTTTDTAGQVLGDVATGTPPTAAAIADAVWDEATSGHTSAGTFGKAAGDTLAAVDTEVAAIKAKTDNLPSSPAAAGDIPSAATVASAVRTELATELGRVDAAVSTRATQTSVDTVAGYVDTEVAAIKAKTDLIPASPAAVGSAMTLTSAYDAAKTAASQASVDDLPTNAELATALAAADDAVLAAIAALHNLSQADVRSAVGLASANLDTQLGTLAGYVDTEIGTILSALSSLSSTLSAVKTKTDGLPSDPADESQVEAAITAVANAIAALNNLSAAQVLAAAAASPIAANVKQVNDVNLTGDGVTTPWGPA